MGPFKMTWEQWMQEPIRNWAETISGAGTAEHACALKRSWRRENALMAVKLGSCNNMQCMDQNHDIKTRVMCTARWTLNRLCIRNWHNVINMLSQQTSTSSLQLHYTCWLTGVHILCWHFSHRIRGAKIMHVNTAFMVRGHEPKTLDWKLLTCFHIGHARSRCIGLGLASTWGIC